MPARERLNVYQLAARIGVHPSTVVRYRHEGIVPDPTRLGGRIFWFADEIDEWERLGYPRPETNTEGIAR